MTANTPIEHLDQPADEAAMLRLALAEKDRELITEKEKLAKLADLGVSMAAEHDEARLLALILDGAKDVAGAEGGTLYVRNEADELAFRIIRNDRLNIRMGGRDEPPTEMPPVQLFDDRGAPNIRNVVSYSAHELETTNIADAYDNTRFDFSGTRIFDKANKYRSTSFLTVPLRPRGGDVIGALQLINALDSETGQPIPFATEVESFVELLAAQAAVALENHQLIQAQKELLDSFVRVIAGSIDAKSPYTGGHCARVPELGIMLTDAASVSEDPAFVDFAFETEDERREFRIGAWLHDCGKVTTPEYVVDKATKLETIYNRIHEIRTRFEVLHRDCEIEYLNALLAANKDGCEIDKAALTAERDRKLAQLQDDFALLAECNIGGEMMDADKTARLLEIAKTRWTRYFDNRLGLSYDEMSRHTDIAAPTPCEEPLLADRPEHIQPRKSDTAQALSALGFKMPVPTYQYNFGEIYNLTIERGTLSEEERFVINDHIIQTLIMLEELPFPKHLGRVPEYAGTHHEKLDGTGHPRGLDKDQLSIPARIMAVADIFEALTASDRPYKAPKSLNESVRIMSFMVKDGHIDADVFRLFLESGVHLQYAERYLDKTQIDRVDIAQYIGALK